MEEEKKEKLNRTLSFWQDMLKMIQLLALYFCIYYGFSALMVLLKLQGNASRYMGIAAYVVCGTVVFFLLPKDHRKLIPRTKKKDATGTVLLVIGIICTALGFAYFLNRGFAQIPWDKILPENAVYSSADAFKVPPLVSLLGYGFFAPFAEEVAFRGILFKYMSKWIHIVPAILISAVVFGLYHGNVMQAIYAFLMGILLALMVHLTDSLGASILFHMSANILVTIYANIPEFYAFLMGIPGLLCISLCLIGGIILIVSAMIKGKAE